MRDILTTAVEEVRSLFEVHRAIVYRFNDEHSGSVVAEAVVPPWTASLNTRIQDTCFAERPPQSYLEGRARAIDDVHQASLTPCHLELLDRFDIKANLIAPLQSEPGRLWGLLIVQQCDRPRHWQADEIDLLEQLGTHLGVAIQQSTLLDRLQQSNQRLEAQVAQQIHDLQQQLAGSQAAEQQLRFQAQLLSQIQEAAIATDGRGRITYWNRAAERLYYLDAETVCGRRVEDCFSGVWQTHSDWQQFQTALTVRGLWFGEAVHHRADGTEIVVEIAARHIQSPNSQTGGWLATIRDISDRRSIETALRQSEEQFGTLVEAVPVGIFLTDAEGSCRYVNPYWCHISGLQAENARDYGWTAAIHPDDRDLVLEVWLDSLREDRQFLLEYRFLRPNGEIRWVVGCAIALYDDRQYISGYLGTVSDITERKHTQDALRQSEEKFRQLAENIRHVFFIIAATGETLYLSPAYEEIWQRSPNELSHNPNRWIDYIHPEDRDRVVATFKYHLQQGTEFESTHRILRPNGEIRWISTKSFPIADERGQPYRFAGFAEDITERQLAQDALRQSEEKFRQLAENIRQVFFILAADGQMLYISPAYREIWQRDPEELYKNPRLWIEAVHPEDRDRIVEGLDQQIENQQTFEDTYQILRQDGEMRWIACRSFPVPQDDGRSYRFVGLAEDITERKLSENALQRQYSNVLLLRNLTDEIRQSLDPQQIFHTAAHQIGRAFHVSRCLIFSHTNGEYGSELRGVAEYRQPTCASRRDVQMVVPGNPYLEQLVQQDVALLCEDVPGNTDLRRVCQLCKYGDIQAIALVRTSYQDEVNGAISLQQCDRPRNWHSDEINLLEAVAAQLGIAIAQANLLQRETQQRETLTQNNLDLERANQKAEAANRAKSRFLAMMSHEIRTPLNAVIGNTDLLLDSPLNADQQAAIHTIRNSSETLLLLINDILDFSKIESGRFELDRQPFELYRCLGDALDLVTLNAHHKGLDLAYLVDEDIPQFWYGDVTRFKQILINLLGNAVKFTERGEVVLSVSATPLDSQQHRYQLYGQVRDTGIGIPSDRLDRLFEPFTQSDSSMSRRYGGTGLGLSISKRLCEMMNGRIWVESELGRGSTFHFTLELDRHLDVLPSDELVRELEQRHLLVVAGDDLHRRAILERARAWQMPFRASDNPQESLDWVRSGEFSVDLAIVERSLAGTSGLDLARQLRELPGYQNLPVLLLEAKGDSALDANFIEPSKRNLEAAPIVGILTKPVRHSTLYDICIQALQGDSPKTPVSVATRRLKSPFDLQLADRIRTRILIAEDIPVNQKLVRQLFARFGYRTTVVANGREAITALQQNAFDIVYMDVQMPEMDGFEATRYIRQHLTPQPYIIAMTAHAMKGDREQCLQVGMNDYVNKPVRAQALRETLERYARTHSDVRALAASQTNEAKLISSSSPEVSDDGLPILDESVLQEMQAMVGDMDFVCETLTHYLEDAAVRLQALHEAMLGSDRENIYMSAHALASLSASVGAVELTASCRAIEAQAMAPEVRLETLDIASVNDVWERTRYALTLTLSRLRYE